MFRKLLRPRLAIPFLEGLVRDLAFDEKLRELATLRLTLERHHDLLTSRPRARFLLTISLQVGAGADKSVTLRRTRFYCDQIRVLPFVSVRVMPYSTGFTSR